MKEKKKLIDRYPWFPFVLAFVALISAWTGMITIALKNRVEEVPLEQANTTPGSEEPDRRSSN